MTSTETPFLYTTSGFHPSLPGCNWWQKIIFIHIVFFLFSMLLGGLLTLIFLDCHLQVECFLKIHNKTSRSIDNSPMTSTETPFYAASGCHPVPPKCDWWQKIIFIHIAFFLFSTLLGGLLTLIFWIATRRLNVFWKFTTKLPEVLTTSQWPPYTPDGCKWWRKIIFIHIAMFFHASGWPPHIFIATCRLIVF